MKQRREGGFQLGGGGGKRADEECGLGFRSSVVCAVLGGADVLGTGGAGGECNDRVAGV